MHIHRSIDTSSLASRSLSILPTIINFPFHNNTEYVWLVRGTLLHCLSIHVLPFHFVPCGVRGYNYISLPRIVWWNLKLHRSCGQGVRVLRWHLQQAILQFLHISLANILWLNWGFRRLHILRCTGSPLAPKSCRHDRWKHPWNGGVTWTLSPIAMATHLWRLGMHYACQQISVPWVQSTQLPQQLSFLTRLPTCCSHLANQKKLHAKIERSHSKINKDTVVVCLLLLFGGKGGGRGGGTYSMNYVFPSADSIYR